MPWSWGGALQGASRGAQALVDMLQYNKQQEAEAERERIENERRARLDEMSRFIAMQQIGAQGGRVAEGTKPVPWAGLESGPTHSFDPGIIPPGSREETKYRLPVLTDELSRIEVDPSRSFANLQKVAEQKAAEESARRLNAARAAFSNDPTPENRAAFLQAGGNPLELERLAPTPPAPKVTLRETGRGLERFDEGGNALGLVVDENGRPIPARAPRTPSPTSNPEVPAVRAYVQSARAKYVAGERDVENGYGYTVPPMTPADAQRKAIQDAIEVHGADAVKAAGFPVPAAPGAGGRAGGAGQSEEQRLWDAAVALHGREKVLAEYGPRPVR